MKKFSFSILILFLLLTLVGCVHEHKYTEDIVLPTCTEKGYVKYSCECGDSYDEEVAAIGHLYGEWVVVKEATETEKGTKEKTCEVCKDKQTEEIPVLVHTHNFKEKVVAPTCTEKGYTEYTCECGETKKENEVAALGHKEEIVAGKEATCTEDGLTEGKKCSVCNEVLVEQTTISSKGHSYGDWVVVKEATETDKGSKEKTCSVCNNKETQEIPVLGHVHDFKEKVVAPTCTEKGYTEYTCECGETKKEKEVAALGHKEEIVAAVAATCTTDGSTEGKVCSVCNKVLVDIQTISALGHSYGEWVVVKESTETEKGYKEKTCSLCNDKQTEELPLKEVVVGVTTVKEVLDAAASLEDKAKLENEYTVVGKVTAITEAYTTQYKNITFKLSDGTGEILCFRCKGDAAAALAVGDTITVTGEVQNYGGTIEFVYAALSNRVAGEGGSTTPEQPEQPEVPTGTSTVKEVLDANKGLADQTESTVEYTVTGKVTEITETYTEQYKNISFKLSDGTGEILCFRCKGDSASVLAVGDTITVKGKVKNYYGTIELVYAALSNRVAGEGGSTTPSTPSEKGDVTIEMTEGNRTVGTAEQNVFVSNGVTVTNDKAASTSDLKQHADHARFYAHSSLKIEYTSKIAKIVIKATESKYVLPADATLEGATLTVEGSVLTITLSTPSTSFTIADLVKQVRAKSIEIYVAK